jgi:predicted metal-binding protein
MYMQRHDDQEIIDALVNFAVHAGATKARRLPPASVRVEDRLANFCREPKCPYHGQSMSCPPHVSGPAGIRKLLQSCKHALVIRIEIQSASLHGADRPTVMRLLHEITAEVETEAKRHGFSGSIGFAGGSCKESFCAKHPNCRVLAEHGECRHPRHARTSMSGYGVNVGELTKSAGWSNRLFSPDDAGEQLAWVAGLVLVC